ncbi:hypothetical protein [Patiriisocius hiemis]|uniref:Uncharacterized protein n=1 Tax=Patiriisocius hiemis TaxID=3075604 RepID=A0ABU2YBM5_9FLAO|nr:hypothetical protein [Constantimarinum sp. W242]MDT0555592.1 hypothetical protein [Constantimarinum sp. W242]
MKQYTTFEELDRDIKYYKLKANIEQEELKMGFSQTQDQIENLLSPVSILMNILSGIAKKAAVLKIVDLFFGGKKSK